MTYSEDLKPYFSASTSAPSASKDTYSKESIEESVKIIKAAKELLKTSPTNNDANCK